MMAEKVKQTGSEEMPDIRAMQMKTLDILRVVADICESHGLRYWLDSGTCLGAIRHGGFIPWDDDVDIGMPRKDFEKFRALVRGGNVLPDHLALWDYDENRRTTRMFLKIHDIRTTNIYAGYLDRPELYVGFFVDVFPYDGYPASALARKLLRARIKVLRRLNHALRMPQPENTVRSRVQSLADRFVPYNTLGRRIEKVLSRRDVADSAYACTLVWGDWYIVPSSCLLPTESHLFEGREYPCPADCDTYLTCVYGDWRKLPPEEERRPKHATGYYSLDQSYLTRWWEKEDGQA